MKKNIRCLLFLFLVGSINVNAQFKGLTYGLKAGISISNIKETQDNGVGEAYNPILSKVGGVYIAIPIQKRFSIQSEVLYSEMGAKSQHSNSPNPYPQYNTGLLYGFVYGGQLNLSYLNIPVMAKYTIGKTGLSLMAGPQIGFLLSAKLGYYGGTDYKSKTESYEVAGVVGAEYALPFGFNISARYQTGFTNIAKDNGEGLNDKNKAFTIAVEYGLKKIK